MARTFVFISYRYESDSDLAKKIAEHLRGLDCSVFRGEDVISLGTDWVPEVERALSESNFFVLILSRGALESEMVVQEVEIARELLREHKRPRILPIFVDLNLKELSFDLRTYLRRLHRRHWRRDAADLTPLLSEIAKVVLKNVKLPPAPAADAGPGAPASANSPPAPAAGPEQPQGEMPIDSRYYIERQSRETGGKTVDRVARDHVFPGHALVRIKGSRQAGKSSLMARLLFDAAKQGAMCATLNFQGADRDMLHDFGKIAGWFCQETSRKLGLEPAQFDPIRYGVKVASRAYFDTRIFANTKAPIVIGLDEADLLLENPGVAVDFYSMFRDWWTQGVNVNPTWKRLSIVVAQATEPYAVLPEGFQSPFDNVVGHTCSLEDFDEGEVKKLVDAYELALSAAELIELRRAFGGHPYLVRRALFERKEGAPFERIVAQALAERGALGDHLKRIWWLLRREPPTPAAIEDTPELRASREPLLSATRRLLESCPVGDGGTISDVARSRPIERLESLGVVTLVGEHDLAFRCGLYAQYLGRKLEISTTITPRA